VLAVLISESAPQRRSSPTVDQTLPCRDADREVECALFPSTPDGASGPIPLGEA
jgi:hypothetical protein